MKQTKTELLSIIDKNAMDYCDYCAEPHQMNQEDLLASIDIDGFIVKELGVRVCDLTVEEYSFVKDSLESFFVDALFEDPHLFAI